MTLQTHVPPIWALQMYPPPTGDYIHLFSLQCLLTDILVDGFPLKFYLTSLFYLIIAPKGTH